MGSYCLKLAQYVYSYSRYQSIITINNIVILVNSNVMYYMLTVRQECDFGKKNKTIRYINWTKIN